MIYYLARVNTTLDCEDKGLCDKGVGLRDKLDCAIKDLHAMSVSDERSVSFPYRRIPPNQWSEVES